MTRAIAFFLPQYHPIPENDEWWGPGFTEWTNVTRARPQFRGHHQPQLPADLGFYDLRVPEVREKQAELAREYGIHGFCYYHYSFSGKRRLLERPFNEVLASGKPDFPFCLCWANESWTRRWDGGEKQILVGQVHSEENDQRMIREVIPAFRDPRYIRVDGRPLFLVYRTELLDNPRRTTEIWREECVKAGVGDPYLVRTESFEIHDPADHGFDAAYEFFPHRVSETARIDLGSVIPDADPADDERFQGALYAYDEIVRTNVSRARVPYKRFRGIIPGWDNTARRKNRAVIILGNTPSLYRYWLSRIVEQTREMFRGDEQLVFINAWNEWAEGCHLEPDLRDGRSYLEATRTALREDGRRDLDAWIREGQAAANDPARARAWIAATCERLRLQEDMLLSMIAEVSQTDRQVLSEATSARILDRGGHRVVSRVYELVERLKT